MRIRLLTITHKSPDWIKQGYLEYSKRLPPSCALELVEIPAEKRTPKSDLNRLLQREAEKMLSVIHADNLIIALDIKGKMWSTQELAVELQKWQQSGKNIDLLIGGPEGLPRQCLEKAHLKWSLSPLTFPHILVKLILAEQIYRAWSINHHHPYHR